MPAILDAIRDALLSENCILCSSSPLRSIHFGRVPPTAILRSCELPHSPTILPTLFAKLRIEFRILTAFFVHRSEWRDPVLPNEWLPLPILPCVEFSTGGA
jgi:hypothetical protein